MGFLDSRWSLLQCRSSCVNFVPDLLIKKVLVFVAPLLECWLASEVNLLDKPVVCGLHLPLHFGELVVHLGFNISCTALRTSSSFAAVEAVELLSVDMTG